jgi:hypothetical protein
MDKVRLTKPREDVAWSEVDEIGHFRCATRSTWLGEQQRNCHRCRNNSDGCGCRSCIE